MKCSVFIATSLDGFISRTDGGIDWLDAANRQVPPGEDCGYRQFMSTVDGRVAVRANAGGGILSTRILDFGCVQSRYRVVKQPAISRRAP